MQMNTFPAVSVIVVGYNSLPYLEDCLAALSRQDYPGELDLLFVDNASTDESAAYVRSSFPDVRVVETGDNRGYAGGNNEGAGHASGELLAFLNPDTRPEPDWLRELVTPLLRDDAVGLTTSKVVLMDDPGVINACGNDLSLTGITTCRHAGEPAADVVVDEEITAVSGAAFAIRRELFERLEGFDERFWMYLEDTDLTWRARLAGYRAVLAARSVVAHAYTLALPPRKTELVERNRYLMLAKNTGLWSLLILWPYFLLGELLTWGWAALNGRAHLSAKLRALVWVFLNPGELSYGRRAVCHLRRMPDGLLLREHRLLPPIAEIASDAVGRRLAVLLDPLVVALALPTFWLLGVPQLVGGAGPVGMGWTVNEAHEAVD